MPSEYAIYFLFLLPRPRFCSFSCNTCKVTYVLSQLAFYVNLHRAVICPSATLTGRWRPDIDLRRMLTGVRTMYFMYLGRHLSDTDHLSANDNFSTRHFDFFLSLDISSESLPSRWFTWNVRTNFIWKIECRLLQVLLAAVMFVPNNFIVYMQ